MTRWRSIFIAAFLAAQVALPLRYYLGGGDRYDERFAWRMFSPLRMTRCQVAMTRDGDPVPLYATFHSAWIGLATRGRAVVLEAMAQHACRGARDVRLTVRCTPPDGAAPTGPTDYRGERNLCGAAP